MKRKKQPLRNKAVTVNFNQQEFDDIKGQQERTTCPNMSLYLRKRVLGQKIVTTIRNRSQDDILEEISKIQKSLRTLSNVDRSGFAKQMIQLDEHMNTLRELIKRLLDLWLP